MKITSWNIQGLRGNVDGIQMNKLKSKQVEGLLKNNDIIFLQETHLNPKHKDDIYLSGYRAVHYCRPKTKRSSISGGISIFVKEEYREYIRFLPNNNPDIAWLQIKKHLLRSPENQDLYIGCVYIPPENSSYGKHHTQKIWEELEEQIEKISEIGNIILCGDFNARTGLSDQEIICLNDYDNEEELSPDNHERCSMDLKIQKFGRKLIQICNNNNMQILNGRIIGDLEGKFTCIHPNGSSVIDYFVCTNEIKQQICTLKIKDFTEYSDHSPLELNTTITIEKNGKDTRKKGENENKNNYKDNASKHLY